MEQIPPPQFSLTKLTVKPRTDIDQTQWDAFVERSPYAWLYHTYDMQDAIATWPGKSDISFALVDEEKSGEIVAIIPLHHINRPFLRLFPNSHIESMGGIACHPLLSEKQRIKVTERAIEIIHKMAEKNHSEEIRVYLSPLTPYLLTKIDQENNPLINLGFLDNSGQTWIIDLRNGKDQIWKRMEKRARNAIRKAQKNGVAVQRITSYESVETYYELHGQTYTRTGARLLPKQYFEKIWQDFIPNSRAVIFGATIDNITIAMESFGIYKNAAVYWSGAANQQGLTYQANSLIQWTAIQWMIDNGINWYETGEAFPNERVGKRKGLNDFKKSFGGTLSPIYRGKKIAITGLPKIYHLLRSIKEKIS